MHLTALLLFSTTALAFNLRFFNGLPDDNDVCKDSDEVADLIIRDPKLSDGCQKLDPAIGGKSMLVDWTKEEDNDLIIQFFYDEYCCNGQTGSISIRTGWSDKCKFVSKEYGEGKKSFRIMDPDDINKGKEGEKYDCQKKAVPCSKAVGEDEIADCEPDGILHA
ncbi:unnamed protein product [Periconia digitata]|uniref:Uncharacterized protein n=1 Tax=Periconia digitata TaxID=1303443 RepID=A0A9W4UND6_9PLEO|nr:unnamed protein product [Periconia digitata]